jgi:hypothetical protein
VARPTALEGLVCYYQPVAPAPRNLAVSVAQSDPHANRRNHSAHRPEITASRNPAHPRRDGPGPAIIANSYIRLRGTKHAGPTPSPGVQVPRGWTFDRHCNLLQR